MARKTKKPEEGKDREGWKERRRENEKEIEGGRDAVRYGKGRKKQSERYSEKVIQRSGNIQIYMRERERERESKSVSLTH